MSILDGARQLLAKPVTKKQLFTAEMLTILVKDANQYCSLSNVSIATAALLACAGFLQFDEPSALRPVDLRFADGMVTLLIRKSKTDQLCKGDEVVIAQTNTLTCQWLCWKDT